MAKAVRANDATDVWDLRHATYRATPSIPFRTADLSHVYSANPDLRLFSPEATPSLAEEQQERLAIIFEMLISLFERAYLLLYDDHMSPKQARRWHSWEDYVVEWCRRSDFRSRLPQLLSGEDPGFAGRE